MNILLSLDRKQTEDCISVSQQRKDDQFILISSSCRFSPVSHSVGKSYRTQETFYEYSNPGNVLGINTKFRVSWLINVQVKIIWIKR